MAAGAELAVARPDKHRWSVDTGRAEAVRVVHRLACARASVKENEITDDVDRHFLRRVACPRNINGPKGGAEKRRGAKSSVAATDVAAPAVPCLLRGRAEGQSLHPLRRIRERTLNDRGGAATRTVTHAPEQASPDVFPHASPPAEPRSINHAFALRLAATALSCAFVSAQAVFTPIPSPFAPVVIPFNGACYASGGSGSWSSVRVPADGSTVATVVYQGPGVGSNGTAIRRGVVWTEAGGTQVITPDLFTISSEIFVPTGISADGNTVFGDQWMWSRTGGLQNLYATLQKRVAAAGYFFASQILVCGASADGSVVTGIVEDQVNNRQDCFLWQVGSPSLQVLPSNAQFGPACARFQSLSGNGPVVGGSALQLRPTFGDFSTAVLVSAAGSTAISGQSTGCNYSGLWDVNFDGGLLAAVARWRCRFRSGPGRGRPATDDAA